MICRHLFIMKRGEENSLSQEVQLAEDVEAPVEEGQLLGKVVVSKEGTVLGEYPIRAKNAVAKIDFKKGMEILFARCWEKRSLFDDFYRAG